MKKLITTGLALSLSLLSFGQFSTTTLDFNNVAVKATDAGILFQDELNFGPAYELPKGSGINAIYNAAFWFAGIDTTGTLRMSATSYASNADMFPGPISSTSMYTDSAYLAKYSPAHWTVTKAEIDDHWTNWWQPGYVMPAAIMNWPGNGDASLGVADQLAPFVDMNGNNLYEPELGDHPAIRGDKATFIISNDMAQPHTNSLGQQLGIENHIMLYQYTSTDFLNNTTFITAHVYNRGPHTYSDFKCTFNTDLDIGNFSDDFVGCDSVRNMIFGYNGDGNDEDNGASLGYGVDPPAIGVITLNDQLDGSGYFTQIAAYPYNDPSGDTSHWNFMNNRWADSSAWVVGGTGAIGSPGAGTTPTNYLLSGDPNDSTQWSELSSGNIPGDRRVFMNLKSVSLPSQSDHCYEFAVVYSREFGNDHVENVTSLKANADLAQAFYDSHTEFSCDQVILGTSEIEDTYISIYPNPSSGSFYVAVDESITDFELVVIDMSGRIIERSLITNQSIIEVNSISKAGLYFVDIYANGKKTTQKVIIN